MTTAPADPRLLTSHDVARAAGVSQSTVSRALRDDPRVARETRDRIRDAATRLGYVPSEIGRSLVTRRTRTLAIVVTDLTSVFYPHLVAPLHDAATDAGYRMVLFTERIESSEAGSNTDSPDPLLERLVDGSVDGVVLTTSHLDGSLPRELARRRVPFVFLTRYVEGVDADAAVVDNAQGASLSVAAALAHGHRRVGAIFGPANASTGRDRERAIRVELDKADVGLDDRLVRRGPFTFEAGHAAATSMLQEDPPPTVILCANDTVAFGAFNAARELGRSIPGDVSLMGFDDLPMAEWEVFGLTTVRQPMAEMARAAVGLLIDRIERRADDAPRRLVFEPTLVLRRTLADAP